MWISFSFAKRRLESRDRRLDRKKDPRVSDVKRKDKSEEEDGGIDGHADYDDDDDDDDDDYLRRNRKKEIKKKKRERMEKEKKKG
ncbi:hypothetical protein M0804_001736 [Polistes exclamans]|nr:hypothetical protein M0804_001736 [Polistes exclamans]